MGNLQNVWNVFIAFPSDVRKEKEIVKEEASKINNVFQEKINCRLQVHSWEEAMPGIGRPQELINKNYVRKADLFIGILWKKWGEPTGEYSSGFKEEFELAKKYHKETGSPKIWLCFKNISQEFKKDPGKQLQKVLDFRENQRNSNNVLYKNFSEEDWRDMVRGLLERFLFDVSTENQEVVEGTNSSQLERTRIDDKSASISEEPENQAIEQLDNLTEFMSVVLQGGNFDPASFEGNEKFYIARLFLFADTLISEQHTGGLMDNHEINLLYRYRRQFKFTNKERYHIYRNLIGSSDDNVPGWYWYIEKDSNTVSDLLFEELANDSNKTVRQRSVEVSSLLGAIPKEDQLENLLSDNSKEVRKETLALIRKARKEELMPWVQQGLSDEDSSVRNEALKAELILIAENDINSAFKKLLNSDVSGCQSVLNSLNAGQIDRDLLLKALKNQPKIIRKFAVEELIKRNDLPSDLAFDLLKDDKKDISKKCYKYLIKKGESLSINKIEERFEHSPGFSGKHEIIFDLFQSYEVDELLKKVNWYEPNSFLAYKALGFNDYDNRKELIRSDLENEFERLREKALNELKDEYTEKVTSDSESQEIEDKVEEEFKKFDNFIRKKFIYSALSVLATQTKESDICFARRYINSSLYEVRLEAVKIIKKVGDVSDLDDLKQISKEGSLELKKTAAEAALNNPSSDADTKEIINEFLETQDLELIRYAFEYAEEVQYDIVPRAEELLQDESFRIREEALSYLIKHQTLDDLEVLLERYLENSRYYYNVVCWLDRILYAPDPLPVKYKEKIFNGR